jgi:glyoxylase-like metal-dependent hydrolase (beta-lactamase superfamily II)
MSMGAIRLPSTVHVLERGWLSSNNVVFIDGAEASVVDTGYCLHAEQTARLVDRVRGERPLTRIINTHLHSDHAGGNARLRAQHAATIAIPPGLAAAVEAWDVEALTYGPTRQQCPRFSYDALLHAGDAVTLGGMSWEVLAAPGHDPHMVMLFNHDERVLISADALWENGFGAIFPEIEGESGFGEQRAALESIGQRAPRAVIPGHGAPFADVGRALERAFARLDSLASSPERNARHVLKVLAKFWLMQVRATSRADARSHFETARYFQVIHRRYFADRPIAAMIDRAFDELAGAGAAAVEGERIRDRD